MDTTKTHTFGGSHLDRYLIDFRAEEADVIGDHGGAPVEAPAEAPAPVAEPWAVSRGDWEATQTQLAESRAFQEAVIGALQDDEGAIPTPAELPNLSDPEAARHYMEEIANQRAEALYKERFEPYMPVIEKITKDEGKRMVVEELDKIANGDQGRGIEGIGDFDREYAAELAHAYFVQGVPADQAIRSAAERTRALQTRAAQGGASGERTVLQNRLSAPLTPSDAGGAAVETPRSPLTGRDRYEQAAADWLEGRRAPGMPVG